MSSPLRAFVFWRDLAIESICRDHRAPFSIDSQIMFPFVQSSWHARFGSPMAGNLCGKYCNLPLFDVFQAEKLISSGDLLLCCPLCVFSKLLFRNWPETKLPLDILCFHFQEVTCFPGRGCIGNIGWDWMQNLQQQQQRPFRWRWMSSFWQGFGKIGAFGTTFGSFFWQRDVKFLPQSPAFWVKSVRAEKMGPRRWLMAMAWTGK